MYISAANNDLKQKDMQVLIFREYDNHLQLLSAWHLGAIVSVS